MAQRRPLNEAWGGAQALRAPRAEDRPVAADADPTAEFFARVRTLPDLLGALGLLPTPEDAFGASEAMGLVGKAGKRIAQGQQSGLGDALKIPRFRNEHGTFLKYEGQWWRMQPAAPDASELTLEYFGKGDDRLLEGKGPLKRRTLNVEDLIRSIREAKGVREPGAPARRRKK